MCGLKKIRLWRMPVAEFEGNAAWLEIGRPAWNLGKWTTQIVTDQDSRWGRVDWTYDVDPVVALLRELANAVATGHQVAGVADPVAVAVGLIDVRDPRAVVDGSARSPLSLSAAPGCMRLDEHTDGSLGLTVIALDDDEHAQRVFHTCIP